MKAALPVAQEYIDWVKCFWLPPRREDTPLPRYMVHLSSAPPAHHDEDGDECERAVKELIWFDLVGKALPHASRT